MTVSLYGGEAALFDVSNIDTINPSLVGRFAQGNVVAEAWSRDGNVLVTAGMDDLARIYNMFDPFNPSLIATVDHANSIYSVDVSPDKQYLVIGGQVSTQIWDVSMLPLP